MHRGRQRKMTASLYMTHFKNDEETGTKEGFWDRFSKTEDHKHVIFQCFHGL